MFVIEVEIMVSFTKHLSWIRDVLHVIQLLFYYGIQKYIFYLKRTILVVAIVF